MDGEVGLKSVHGFHAVAVQNRGMVIAQLNDNKQVERIGVKNRPVQIGSRTENPVTGQYCIAPPLGLD